MMTLDIEQIPFAGQRTAGRIGTSRIAPDSAGRSDHAMAGNDDGQTVSAHGLTGSAAGEVVAAGTGGEFGIRDGGTDGNRTTRGPAAGVECRTGRRGNVIETDRPAREVTREASDETGQQMLIFAPRQGLALGGVGPSGGDRAWLVFNDDEITDGCFDGAPTGVCCGSDSHRSDLNGVDEEIIFKIFQFVLAFMIRRCGAPMFHGAQVNQVQHGDQRQRG